MDSIHSKDSRKQRNVLVTGGSRGIGKSIVKKFADMGDIVWFTYRTGKAESENFIKDELPPDSKAQCFYLDQGNWESHQELIKNLPG